MAIKVGGTEVITNARQLSNIASVDSTTVAALDAAGVGGGGGIELTTSEAVVEGDTLAFNFSTGKVDKVRRTGGNGGEQPVETGTSNKLQIYDIIHIPEANRVAILATKGNGNRIIQVGSHNGTSWTWGTPWQGDSGGDTEGGKLVYASNANRLIAIYKAGGSASNLIYRQVSISGSNVTNEGGGTVNTHNSSTGTDMSHTYSVNAVYSPTHQKVIVAYRQNGNNNGYVLRAGTVGAASTSWGSASSPIYNDQDTRTFGIDVDGSTIAMGYFSQYHQKYYIRSATLSGTTFTLGTHYEISGSYSRSVPARGYVFRASHSSTANLYGYGIVNSSNNAYMLNFTASGTSVSQVNDPQVGYISGSAYSQGATYSYNPTEGRLFVYSQSNHRVDSGTHSTLISTNNNQDNENLAAGTSQTIRSAVFDPDSGLSFSLRAFSNENYIYYYAPQTDNYNFFVGVAKEAASANTTVKIANAGQIATGLSGLTAGYAYRINYDGGWGSATNIQASPDAFNQAQRAGHSGVALTSTTMLMINDFMHN